jgi:hypothetical protein
VAHVFSILTDHSGAGNASLFSQYLHSLGVPLVCDWLGQRWYALLSFGWASARTFLPPLTSAEVPG